MLCGGSTGSGLLCGLGGRRTTPVPVTQPPGHLPPGTPGELPPVQAGSLPPGRGYKRDIPRGLRRWRRHTIDSSSTAALSISMPLLITPTLTGQIV